jgi:casein kinase 1
LQISRIEFIHSRHYIHHDIKPENCLIGLNNTSHIIYIVDFGLANQYRDHTSLNHIPYQQNLGFIGTPRYGSINSHRGIQQTRRDDLESLGYMLIYFLRGSLPWQNLELRSRKYQNRSILEKKLNTSTELCADLPNEFRIYLEYVRNLSYHTSPDYAYLRQLFYRLFRQTGYLQDGVFDWDKCHHLDK